MPSSLHTTRNTPQRLRSMTGQVELPKSQTETLWLRSLSGHSISGHTFTVPQRTPQVYGPTADTPSQRTTEVIRSLSRHPASEIFSTKKITHPAIVVPGLCTRRSLAPMSDTTDLRQRSDDGNRTFETNTEHELRFNGLNQNEAI